MKPRIWFAQFRKDIIMITNLLCVVLGMVLAVAIPAVFTFVSKWYGAAKNKIDEA